MRTAIALITVVVVLANLPAPVRAQAAGSPKTIAPRDGVAAVNAFNRLLKPAGQRNLPPTEDGIHDPASAGTPLLQAPREAFGPLPKANSGNRVNWVAAAQARKIQPIWNATDLEEEADPFDLNIVREVKGSMPDVVFPHDRHTDLLDCTDCHKSLFISKKGANKMSMASIMLGQGCGACHGRVAFPVSECRLCHSRAKGTAVGTAAKADATR